MSEYAFSSESLWRAKNIFKINFFLIYLEIICTFKSFEMFDILNV